MAGLAERKSHQPPNVGCLAAFAALGNIQNLVAQHMHDGLSSMGLIAKNKVGKQNELDDECQIDLEVSTSKRVISP